MYLTAPTLPVTVCDIINKSFKELLKILSKILLAVKLSVFQKENGRNRNVGQYDGRIRLRT